MALSQEELERYSRHIILKGVGLSGQKKLLQGKVLVIGAGGLGAPVLMYLAASGVGTLGIMDDDVVDRSNLRASDHSWYSGYRTVQSPVSGGQSKGYQSSC